MPDIPLIRVFLSSPGDVNAERGKVRRLLEDLQRDPAYKAKLEIEIVAWDDPNSDVLMPVTLSPQAAIDRGLPRPSQCEIVITILWGRMGTPLDAEQHGRKADGSPYWSGTEWEYLDAVRGNKEASSGLPLIYLYRRTDAPPPPDLSNPDVVMAWAEQRKRVDNFFAQFRDSATGAFKAYYHDYDSLDQFEELASRHLRTLLNHAQNLVKGQTNSPTEASPELALAWDIAKDGSPFPGLRAFEERHEKVYFGRSREVNQILKRMAAQRLQVIVGASGSGKSSLVKAGVLPKLRDNALPPSARWLRLTMRPSAKPFLALAESLMQAIPSSAEEAETFAQTLRNAPERLAQYLQAVLKNGEELVLFIDQFEELFTLAPSDAAPFINLITYPSEQLRLLLTIRSDFYDALLPYLEEALRESTYTLARPSQIALLEMIKRPAEVAALQFEEGLAEIIVEDAGLEAGSLALIAYTLDELYERAVKRQASLLTYDDYVALGGVQKVIGLRAEQVFKDLKLASPEKTLQKVFHALVTVDERSSRQYAERQQFEGDKDALRLIAAFVDARLLSSDKGQLEVAHEALLREWKTLADWIELSKDDRSTVNRMRREARTWAERGKPDYLRPNAEILKEFSHAAQRLGLRLEDALLLDFTEAEQVRLYRELENWETSHKRRFDIGERLASIGDNREGIGLKDGIPAMLWLPVAGSKGKFKFSFGEFEIKPFYTSKYLTTYQQFQAFLDSGDYESRRWWHDFPAEYQAYPPTNVANGNANAPMDTISWYQAVAFGRWLDSQYRDFGLFEELPNALNPKDWEIRLPTEWEWQWMAQNGLEKREYPWGAWDTLARANTSEAGIQIRSTAVGVYPDGASAVGALDLAGNLWEWCLNDYDDVKIVNGFNNKLRKVLRGGSFAYKSSDASCTARSHFNPHLHDKDLGLRLVLAPMKAL